MVADRYRNMWLMVGFDLPVRTKTERRLASRFRHDLQNLGFERVQYSFYGFHARTRERLDTIERNVERLIPPGDGWVLILDMTDRQFVEIRHYRGGKIAEKSPVEAPKQLVLF